MNISNPEAVDQNRRRVLGVATIGVAVAGLLPAPLIAAEDPSSAKTSNQGQ
jgi:hypothetical protein